MEYRLFGNTGLKVSVIGFGNCINSDNPEFQDKTTESIKKALEYGINFFDTAEIYGYGEAERQLGVALKTLKVPREDIVVSTKIYYGGTLEDIEDISQKKINQFGVNRKHIKEGVKNSLKRLQLDYADIVFCHRFDHETPLEEVARAFTELIQEGLIHYWGTSEWSAANIFETREICAEKNLIKPAVEQPEYNLLIRDRFEAEYARLFDKYRMASTVWSPLAGGVLTGKYNNGDIPAGTRYNSGKVLADRYLETLFKPEKKEKTLKQLNDIGKLAQELGMTQAQFALSWVIANKDVSTAITGCSKIEQLEETVKCAQLYKKITPEINKRVNEILGNTPDFGINYKNFTPFPPRR